MIYDLIPVKIAKENTYSRPFEFNSLSEPTEVVKSHTTCPSCAGRVIIDHIICDNLIYDGVYNYVYCSNCDYGKTEFEKLKESITNNKCLVDVLDTTELECVFNIDDVPLIDQSATYYVNDLSSVYIKYDSPVVENSDSIIQKIING